MDGREGACSQDGRRASEQVAAGGSRQTISRHGFSVGCSGPGFLLGLWTGFIKNAPQCRITWKPSGSNGWGQRVAWSGVGRSRPQVDVLAVWVGFSKGSFARLVTSPAALAGNCPPCRPTNT